MNNAINTTKNKGKVNPNLDTKIRQLELPADMKDFQKKVLNILKNTDFVI